MKPAMLRRLARKLTEESSVLTLLYHRVADRTCDTWDLCVTPEHFAQHIDVLQGYNCLSTTQLIGSLDKKRLPKRAVVITFDDGYSDNFFNAAPVLRRTDTPATVFITSAYLNNRRGFWWDELETIFLKPGSLPNSLSISIGGETHNWELGSDAEYPESKAAEYKDWKGWKSDTPTSRHQVYRSLYELIQPLTNEVRERTIGQLLSWAAIEGREDSENRPLTSNELRAMADDGLIDIGCHTATHPSLSTLSAVNQGSEINESKQQLEKILGRSVRHFAYPYGRPSDYSEETIRIISNAGFLSAFAAQGGRTRNNDKLFELPRIQVSNVDGEVFSRQLHEWFHK